MSQRPFSSRRLHLVGIGGAGMSGLALIAHELGAEVSGSDRTESPYLKKIRELGIPVTIGHAAENVPEAADVVYSTAVPPENPERRAARGRVFHRADLLAEIAGLRRLIAITGTHGKTTTSAMVVQILSSCGLDPSYVVGGELRATGSNAGWGSGDWIVVEADESDRSLLKLWPEIAVLTSAELDHHATYRSLAEVEETFSEFMARAGERAVVFDRPELRSLCPPGSTAYDVSDPVLLPDETRFHFKGIEVRLSIPGLHNAINAAGALSASVLAGVDPVRCAAALSDFRGTRRRFEHVGETAAGVPVYDDYAHHPTEVDAAIAAARTLQPERLVAVFQPHLFSRTAMLAQQFGRALASADLVVVLSVYPAREQAEEFPGVDGHLLASAAADAANGRPVAWLPELEDAERFLESTLRPGDLCLTMGAGDIDRLAATLVG